MTDLISRKDAIDWCLEGLSNMPSESGWIPVTDGLPETVDEFDGEWYSKPVLVTYASAIDGKHCCDGLACYCDDGRWYWWEDEPQDTESVRVTINAWMPLPQPWEGR